MAAVPPNRLRDLLLLSPRRTLAYRHSQRQDRYRGVSHHLLGDAPDEEVGETGAPGGCHDDAVMVTRRVENSLARVADLDAHRDRRSIAAQGLLDQPLELSAVVAPAADAVVVAFGVVFVVGDGDVPVFGSCGSDGIVATVPLTLPAPSAENP